MLVGSLSEYFYWMCELVALPEGMWVRLLAGERERERERELCREG